MLTCSYLKEFVLAEDSQPQAVEIRLSPVSCSCSGIKGPEGVGKEGDGGPGGGKPQPIAPQAGLQ